MIIGAGRRDGRESPKATLEDCVNAVITAATSIKRRINLTPNIGTHHQTNSASMTETRRVCFRYLRRTGPRQSGYSPATLGLLETVMTTRRDAITWLGAGLAGASFGVGNVSDAAARRGRAMADPWLAYDRYLDQARRDWRVPGLGIAIVRDGALIYAKGFGVANVDTGAPVTADTLFNAGSTTKAFTAAGIAMLVDQGKLNWDAPVRTYLPSFRLGHGDDYASTNLRDMMSHRTGLARHDLVWYNNKDLSLDALLARVPYLETFAPLRAQYQYNNITVMLAGHALEKASGMTWEEFTTTSILKPLGMTRSNMSCAEMDRKGNAAVGHRLRDKTFQYAIPRRPEDRIGPAGAMNSTVNDYAKWMLLQLGKGKFNGTQLFSPAQSAMMWEPVITTGGIPSNPELSRGFYGLGWRIDSYRGIARVAHGGNLNGFSSRVSLFPDKNIGIVAFTNLGASPLAGHVTLDVLDMLLGLEPARWSTRNLARRDAAEAVAPAESEPKPIPATSPSRSLSSFAGRFHHKGYGDLFVEVGPTGLRASYNAMPMALVHWHYDVFNALPDRGEDADLRNIKFVFQENAEGQIASFTAKMDEDVPPILFERI
jgi:CubicO group peptidase (beta-lactamase class C family)